MWKDDIVVADLLDIGAKGLDPSSRAYKYILSDSVHRLIISIFEVNACLYNVVVHWLLTGAVSFTLNKSTGLYDQPEAAKNLLSYFLQQNTCLDRISLNNEYSFDNLKLSKLNTLRELVLVGQQERKYAMPVFEALLNELTSLQRFDQFSLVPFVF